MAIISIIIWFIVGGAILCIYLSQRWTTLGFEEDHIYIADIIIGLISLPWTIIAGLCFLGDKLIHIKIK